MSFVKIGAAGLAAALAFAAFGYQKPAVDPMTTASVDEALATRDDLRVLVAGADIGCTLHRTRMTGVNVSLLVPDQTCASEDLLASARFWTDKADGTVEISDENGQPFLQLAAGDGSDYETYGAGAPLIQFVAY